MGECDLYFILEKMADFFWHAAIYVYPTCLLLHAFDSCSYKVGVFFSLFFYRIVFLIIFQGEFDVPPGMHGSDVC